MTVVDNHVNEWQADREFTELSEELANYTTDLLALRRHEPFLEELWAQKPGNWVDVFALNLRLGHLTPRIEQLKETLNGPLFATWLDYPEPNGNADVCTIIFFAPDLVWSNTAIYHKQRLLQRKIHPRNGA